MILDFSIASSFSWRLASTTESALAQLFALAKAGTELDLFDLAKAKAEILKVFLQLKLEAIDKKRAISQSF